MLGLLNYAKKYASTIGKSLYAIYHELFKRRLCKEHVRKKSTTREGLICAEILPLRVLPPSPQRNNLALA